MKKSLLTATLLAVFALAGEAYAAGSFASSVLSYTPGPIGNPFGGPHGNSSAALGQPGNIVGAGSGFDGVFSPFNPHYEASDLTAIAFGGELTLQLQNFVLVAPGLLEIGVWSNVGLTDTSYPNGVTDSSGSTNSTPRSARVSVSADGVNWVFVNGGALITFTNPGNFYLNAGPQDPAAPASPQYADFGKPFTGTPASFANENYTQVLATLNGSAGGTWLDLDSTGLTKVGYIRFDNVPSGQVLDIDAVGINGTSIGSPVPEPSSLILLAGALALGAGRRFRGLCDRAS